MTSKARIPRTFEEFNTYITTTSSYMADGTPTTNAVRLGLLDAEVAQWTALGTEWSPLFVKYGDKKNSRTTAIKDQMLLIVDNVVNLDQTQHILDRIAASPNVTIADMETFNIKKGVLQKTTRTVSTTPINEAVVSGIQLLGGGSVAIKCRTTSGERASICEGADCVQYNYMVGTTPPTSADDQALKSGLSTKASFNLVLGAASSEKKLYIYFRWNNTKHPELAGPWSALQTTLIV